MGRVTPPRFFPLLPVLLLTAPMLGACSTSATQDSVCHGQQIIITFAAGVAVTGRTFNAGLSRTAGIQLDYMRHLFDDHHLYCAVPGKPAHSLAAALEHLRERADIRAVEIDRIKHPASTE